MIGSPASFVAIAFGSGVLAAEYAPLWLCGCVSLLVLVVLSARVRRRALSTAAILAAAFLVGAWRYDVGRIVAADDVCRFVPYVTAVEGLVASDAEADRGRIRFVLRVDRARVRGDWSRASGRIIVSVYPERRRDTVREPRQRPTVPDVQYGARLRIMTSPYLPPEPTNPSSFSWRAYLARKGIYSCVSVRDRSKIELLAGNGANPLIEYALRARHGLVRSIDRLYHLREGSVTAGMVLGMYSYLPEPTLRSFSRTGTLHLLAASGYNCWVLVFLLTPLLKLARVLPRWRGLFVIAAIIMYLLMVGGKPSLMRAAIMASLVLLARPLKRVPDTTVLFFIAALVILIIDPANLFDVGFQLSFASVWAIIRVSPILGAKSLLNWAGLVEPGPQARLGVRFVLRKLGGVLGATAVATLAVTLVTAPVVAYYFNYVSLVSIPANMAVEFGVPVVFAVGFLSPVGAHFGFLGSLLGYVGDTTARAMLSVVDTLGDLRWSAVSVESPGVLAILGYYVILFGVLSYVRSKNVS
ncbi:MAG: ComEC/Rec2 family competence protein [Armatimonadota bacterium]